MYASSVVPESLNYPHDLVGHDHDSVGLFQQRPSMGWGTVAELMDPAKSAGAFYDALVTKTNWETRDLGEVAQSVQGSAHPERYGPAMLDGAAILATIDQSGQGGAPAGGTATATTTTAAGAPTTTVAGGATTTIPPPAASTATPSKVFLVGDSLTAGAEASHLVPSTWTIDAKVGRTTAEGIEILKTTDLASYDAVIVALGANDYGATEAAYKDQIATVMTHVGATKPIWWVNVDVGSPKLAAAAGGPNKALAAAVYPNLKVGDWSTEASTKITAAMRASDGIHYNAEGYKVYAAYLAALPAGTGTPTTAECKATGGGGTAGTVIDIDTGLPISICPWAGGDDTNCQIVKPLNDMVAAAAAEGLTLTGGSFRDPQEQIELRKKHCGTSYHEIYEVSSSSCHPPTAKPGTSQHEKGLAIDFRCNGSGIGQYDDSNPCFIWLTAHAAGFGFYNLPSENWHWSTTGG
jgi:lysophospholipase L1-like esterase